MCSVTMGGQQICFEGVLFFAKQANELSNLLNSFMKMGPNPLKPCTTLVTKNT